MNENKEEINFDELTEVTFDSSNLYFTTFF